MLIRNRIDLILHVARYTVLDITALFLSVTNQLSNRVLLLSHQWWLILINNHLILISIASLTNGKYGLHSIVSLR